MPYPLFFPAFLATFKQITTASMPIPYLFQSLIGISVPVRKPRTLDLCLLSVYISRFWHLDYSTDIRSKKIKRDRSARRRTSLYLSLFHLFFRIVGPSTLIYDEHHQTHHDTYYSSQTHTGQLYFSYLYRRS